MNPTPTPGLIIFISVPMLGSFYCVLPALNLIPCLLTLVVLTLKVLVTTTADDTLKNVYFYYFLEKIRLDISCELSADHSHDMPNLILAKQMIHMKCQALFSLKKYSNQF